MFSCIFCIPHCSPFGQKATNYVQPQPSAFSPCSTHFVINLLIGIIVSPALCCGTIHQWHQITCSQINQVMAFAMRREKSVWKCMLLISVAEKRNALFSSIHDTSSSRALMYVQHFQWVFRSITKAF